MRSLATICLVHGMILGLLLLAIELGEWPWGKAHGYLAFSWYMTAALCNAGHILLMKQIETKRDLAGLKRRQVPKPPPDAAA